MDLLPYLWRCVHIIILQTPTTANIQTTGLFNPAVCLGLALIGAISWSRAGLVFIAEMFGAMASAGVVAALFPSTMAVQTTLGGSTSLVRGLCKFGTTTDTET